MLFKKYRKTNMQKVKKILKYYKQRKIDNSYK